MRVALGRWFADVRHLLGGAVLDLVGLGLVLITAAAALLSVVPRLGPDLLLRVVALTRRVADHQRGRVPQTVERPYLPLPQERGARLRTVVGDPATWRDLLWAALPAQAWLALIALALALTALQGLAMPVVHLLMPDADLVYNGIPVTNLGSSLLTIPVGLGVGALAVLAPPALIDVEGRLTRSLLGPTAGRRLALEVERLTETRSEAVDASAVELRRIERDLHDGAQARLVSLAMNLGMAQDALGRDHEEAGALIDRARVEAHAALTELRDLVRGIHPPLLADRGIGDALQALALASPIPVSLELHLGRRLPPPVESAAYFTMVELLANAVKHSGAEHITLAVTDRADHVALRVWDDGRGGAEPSRGSGLRGITRRLAAFDGDLRVTSPPGGPTTIEAELPCAS